VKTETTTGDAATNIEFDDDNNSNNIDSAGMFAQNGATSTTTVTKAEPSSSSASIDVKPQIPQQQQTSTTATIERRESKQRYEVAWRSKANADLLYVDALDAHLDELDDLNDPDLAFLNSVRTFSRLLRDYP
jgi:hypothetical protein